jgi:cell division protein FtsB
MGIDDLESSQPYMASKARANLTGWAKKGEKIFSLLKPLK